MSSYRWSMLAYPARYRRAHGPEIVDTASELADGRWSARQSGALLTEGLRTRTRLSTGGSARQAFASGIALALALLHLISLAGVMAVSFDESVSAGSPLLPALLGAGLPLVALTVTTRWPAALAMAAPTVLVLAAREDSSSSGVPWPAIVISHIAPIVLACVVAAVGDGRRALSPAWVIGLLGLTMGAGWVLSPIMAYHAIGWFLLLILPVAGLALVWVDPRPLAAASAARLIGSGNAASALVMSGPFGPRTFVILVAAAFGFALLGLTVAAVAGRRTLSVSR